MWEPHQYQLLDFGGGRRLERFGPLLLDRPCPACEAVARTAPAELWSAANARYDLCRERPPRRSENNQNAAEGVPHRGSWTCAGSRR